MFEKIKEKWLDIWWEVREWIGSIYIMGVFAYFGIIFILAFLFCLLPFVAVGAIIYYLVTWLF